MKINHKRLFIHSLRSALIFVAGFLIYEILLDLEKIWNKNNPANSTYHFYKSKFLKFILILISDLIILYGLTILFNIDL